MFDHAKGRFSDNWNVKYSAYLTYLYGFEHESMYQDAIKSTVSAWNRVLGRIVRGERMTDKNLAYIEEIKNGSKIKFGKMECEIEPFNLDEIISHYRDDDVEIHEEGYYLE
jgi:hypothetical protein